ncbi:MAG: bifunctional glutamate N-acetyltransferase/amino-acid acetyltransferase ArgJ [Pseudomonadota bacterium]
MSDDKLISPLAPKGGFPSLPTIAGVDFATAAAGVKYQGRTDVMLARLVPGTVVAGTFTRSKTRAAPVLDCQAKLGGASEAGAAFLVNSGNANAFTGIAGVKAVNEIAKKTADALGIPINRVFTSSTGVIGEPLPDTRITDTLDHLTKNLAGHGLEAAAEAIMTTDTYPKGAGRQISIDGQTVSIAGIAKGSGMIAPDMATMLVYIFTDAAAGFDYLQKALTEITQSTFNCITVDSDTSTSDTLLLAATGRSGVKVEENGSTAFKAALEEVMTDLAHQVVKDGEGATKFVTVRVSGASTPEDAHRVGKAIADSPLVKTAIAGEDPNWGRIVMAVGKSGAEADRDRLRISFGDVLVAENGQVHPHYKEADAATHMKGEDIAISVDLGLGRGTATIWTCDLTARYIAINADYRS